MFKPKFIIRNLLLSLDLGKKMSCFIEVNVEIKKDEFSVADKKTR